MNCNCGCHLRGKPFCSECWDEHEHDDEYEELLNISYMKNFLHTNFFSKVDQLSTRNNYTLN